MHDFCIIPDKCENFWSFVNTMPLTIEEKAIVNQCVLKKVIIDVNNNCWHINAVKPVFLYHGIACSIAKGHGVTYF